MTTAKDIQYIFEIHGRIPSKKNSKQIIMGKPGKRPFVVSSSDYQRWEKDAVKSLGLQRMMRGLMKPITACAVNIDITFPDRIHRDLGNVAEGILDAMVLCGIIEDDNWMIVKRLVLNANGADKERAGAKITINLTGE
jgi:Holliday junction resolvase RusA-like endonuclease